MKIKINSTKPFSVQSLTRFMSKLASSTLLVMGIMGALLISGQASAKTACKGLDSASCKSNSACGWVGSYQRKDGAKVKAFCRSSGKGTSSKSASKKATKSSSASNAKSAAKSKSATSAKTSSSKTSAAKKKTASKTKSTSKAKSTKSKSTKKSKTSSKKTGK